MVKGAGFRVSPVRYFFIFKRISNLFISETVYALKYLLIITKRMGSILMTLLAQKRNLGGWLLLAR